MSQPSNKKEFIQFGLKSIEMIDFQLTHPQKQLAPDTLFNFDIEINQKFNSELKLVFNLCRIEIKLEDESKVGSIRTSVVYEIPELLDFVTEKNELKLPDGVIVSLNSIAISTTRGILYSETKGTFLHNAVLPIVDPKNFT